MPNCSAMRLPQRSGQPRPPRAATTETVGGSGRRRRRLGRAGRQPTADVVHAPAGRIRSDSPCRSPGAGRTIAPHRVFDGGTIVVTNYLIGGAINGLVLVIVAFAL